MNNIEKFLPRTSLIATMENVITAKETKRREAIRKIWDRFNPVLIGSGIFTAGYLGFQAALLRFPTLSTLPSIALAGTIFGVIGGGFNLAVALVSFREAVHAYQVKDTKQCLTSLFDGLCTFGIGILMILVSLSSSVAALGSVGAFFTANPWILPLLFMLATIPLLAQVAQRNGEFLFRRDLASKILRDIKNGDELLKLVQKDPNVLMGELQANMGVDAAIEMMKLIQCALAGEDISEQRTIVEKLVAAWNRAQAIRLIQQILYIVPSLISLIALPPAMRLHARTLTVVQNLVLFIPNFMGIVMDTLWPFKRNTPIVVL